MAEQKLPAVSLEDEAPRYELAENEPLIVNAGYPQGKSREAVAQAPEMEFIGSALVTQRHCDGELELEVHAGPDGVEFGPFRASVAETLQFIATLADGCHWVLNTPRRQQIRRALDDLARECETLGVV